MPSDVVIRISTGSWAYAGQATGDVVAGGASGRLSAATKASTLEMHEGEAATGYWTLTTTRHLGSGSALYEKAVEALFSWTMHERAGFVVQPSEEVVIADSVVILTTRIGPLRVSAPCRVIRVTRESDRRGFAYGTLPGHPLKGVEEFVVRRKADGEVQAEIKAVSRPEWRLAKVVPPITHRAQRRIAERYLEALVAPLQGST